VTTKHEGGRWCWCRPQVAVVSSERICVVHEASAGKTHGVLRVMYWTAVQM
jgi:hypothetical protein